jgi:hypothetical protein
MEALRPLVHPVHSVVPLRANRPVVSPRSSLVHLLRSIWSRRPTKPLLSGRAAGTQGGRQHIRTRSRPASAALSHDASATDVIPAIQPRSSVVQSPRSKRALGHHAAVQPGSSPRSTRSIRASRPLLAGPDSPFRAGTACALRSAQSTPGPPSARTCHCGGPALLASGGSPHPPGRSILWSNRSARSSHPGEPRAVQPAVQHAMRCQLLGATVRTWS